MLVPPTYSGAHVNKRTFRVRRGPMPRLAENDRGPHMKVLKSQAWRALFALSALVASGLVLEAGRRWGC